MNDSRYDRRDAELDELIRRARAESPDVSAVEPQFETRVMARIREWRAERESWHAWAWRLAPAFLALTILLGAWSTILSPVSPADPGATLGSGTQEVALLAGLTGE